MYVRRACPQCSGSYVIRDGMPAACEACRGLGYIRIRNRVPMRRRRHSPFAAGLGGVLAAILALWLAIALAMMWRRGVL